MWRRFVASARCGSGSAAGAKAGGCPESRVRAMRESATISDEMTELETRITTNPNQCGGRPCVRGMRIRVCDVLDLLASGLTVDQVLEELPDLEREDILACLRFASHSVNHAILAA
jgi:uncharacterized protein (DUF433 family)